MGRFKKIFREVGRHLDTMRDIFSEHGEEILVVIKTVGEIAGAAATIVHIFSSADANQSKGSHTHSENDKL